MSEYMQNIAIVGERSTALIKKEKPHPGPNQVLLKIEMCAICTWEQRVFTRIMPFPLPYVGGHEVVGSIEAIGENLNPEVYYIGRKAAVRFNPSCGACNNCRKGADNMCIEADRLTKNTGGKSMDLGGLSQYYCAEIYQVFFFGDDVPTERMIFAEPLACVLTGFEKVHIHMGDDILVIGGGIMGLLIGLCAKLLGTRVFMSEPNDSRRRKADQIGIDITIDPENEEVINVIEERTGGKGVELVVNTAANKDAFSQGMSALSVQGQFLMYGKVFPNTPVEIDINEIHDNELMISGTMSPSSNSFYRSVNILSKGILKLENFNLLSKVYPYTKAQEAFEEALSTNNYRVAVEF
jgi:L-iditol 2-dehydrogenase